MSSSIIKLGLAAFTVSVPCAALFAAGFEGAGPIAPFGWTHWIVVHTAALALLGWLAAEAIVRLAPKLASPAVAVVWTCVGSATALVTVYQGPLVGVWLDASDAGFWARAAVRLGWCAALQFPWCLAAQAAWQPANSPSQNRLGEGDSPILLRGLRKIGTVPGGFGIGSRPVPAELRRLALLLATLTALALPVVYADQWTRRQTDVLSGLLAKNRLAASSDLAERLDEVGSRHALSDTLRSPADVLTHISRIQAATRRRLGEPLPTKTTISALLLRAGDLATLGEFSAARALLAEPSRRDPRAALFTAGMLQEERMWQQSNRWYRTALDLVRPAENQQHPGALALVRAAYSDMAANLRELRRYREAEDVYHEAIRRQPIDEAYFRFQLGEHYRLAGRPINAAEEFQAAARLDPAQFAGAAERQLSILRSETPACFTAFPLAMHAAPALDR